MEVYTKIHTPFRLGANYAYIKTEIEEYERINIGQGYFGILFKNPSRQLWHMAQEDCGALIGSNKSKTKLVKSVLDDVKNGSPQLMKEQIELGKKQISQADSLDRDDWFKRFSKSKV